MEPYDFSGYATRNDLRCSDGKTIRRDAFKHMDGNKVPLVWQHQHNETANVLGHGLLENREDGVYVYGFFNSSESAKTAKELIQHGDIEALSIFANGLTQRDNNVIHGQIREVSLVLAGANPGAMIDNVVLQHADGSEQLVDSEAVIYTGESIEHAGTKNDSEGDAEVATATPAKSDAKSAKTIEEIVNSMTPEQRDAMDYIVGVAVDGADDDDDDDKDSIAQSATDDDSFISHANELFEKGFEMGRNVFEQNGTAAATGSALTDGPSLNHSQIETIFADAAKGGSLKESFIAHAQDYGIQDIDVLFPDARNVSNAPEVIGRRTEWVADVLAKTKHSPIARIKSTAVDLTADEARAKGYVKGNLKKDEIIKLLKRVTTPTTIYKKQKLDRDDIVDIVDLDVVAWLKAEMRVMLDEEVARAILIGDGRESDDEDKIDEDHIRPIATDADMYSHKVTIPSETDPKGVVESILRARTHYKGTGTPTLYTTDSVLTDLILIEDKMGRRVYNTEQELAAALRVDKIVPVEVFQDSPSIMAIIVNLADYTVGADKGGAVSMFDDFDIDYNQYKYLIETRISGALTKPKSALVIRRTLGTVVTPQNPSYNGATNELTIPNQTGVIYEIDGQTKTGTIVLEETSDVDARAAAGYSFPANTNTNWTFVV